MRYFDVLLSHHSKELLGGYYYSFETGVPVGSFVEVDFRNKSEIGVVNSEINNPPFNRDKIKSIKKVIGDEVVADCILKLAKGLSHFYCTSLGETLFELIPDTESNGHVRLNGNLRTSDSSRELIVGHFQKRLLHYLEIISASKNTTLILLPSYRLLDIVKRYLIETLPIPAIAEISDRLNNKEYDRALNALNNSKIKVVLSTRGGVKLLGYNFSNIIIDDPLNFGFFNDRKPAYTTRYVLEQLQDHIHINLYLGSNNVDPESLWQLRHGQLKLNVLSGKIRKSVSWCDVRAETLVGSLTGDINLIVCPYSSADSNNSFLSATSVASQIKGNVVRLEAGKPFKIPSQRPVHIIATKKILDYQELIFDETVILGLNHWLSMPGDDNIYVIMDMIWRLMGQTKHKTYLHSDRAIPVLEDMLAMGIPASLEKFMSSRHTFKMPPYYRKIDIYSDKPSKLSGIIGGINTVIENKKMSTFIDRDKWPPENINEVYLYSNKVLVDAP